MRGRAAASRASCVASLRSRSRQTAEFTVASIHGKQHVILSLFAPEARGQIREGREDYAQVRSRSKRMVVVIPRLCACNARFPSVVVVVLALIVVVLALVVVIFVVVVIVVVTLL